MNTDKIGAFIKLKRKAKNLTQTELANVLGVTEKAISRWETGRGTPDISLLIPLANALDISVLELLNGETINDENKIVIDIIKAKNKKIKLWKYFSLFITNLILVFGVIILIYGYLIPISYDSNPNKGIMTILSESMSPNLKVNDTIVYDILPIDNVNKDDIVVYYFSDYNIKTAHRVMDITNDNNEILLTTKGDNNLEVDHDYVTKDNFIGIYDHKLSKLNNLFFKTDLRITITNNNFKTLAFIALIIISVIYLDTLQIINILKNK